MIIIFQLILAEVFKFVILFLIILLIFSMVAMFLFSMGT